MTHTDVLDWAAAMRNSGLSASSRRKAVQLLGATFKMAARAGVWRGVNPCEGVTVRGDARRSIVALTRDEVAMISRTIGSGGRPDVGDLVELAAHTGLRQSELLGLDARHVDRSRRRIEVRQRLSDVNGTITLGPVKTDSSHRDVPITQAAAEILDRRPSNGLLWPGPISAINMYNRHYKPAVKALEAEGVLEVVPTFHDLRHTYAGWMLAAGVSPKTLQRWMGHASITMTLDTYGALMPDEDNIGLERADQWLR